MTIWQAREGGMAGVLPDDKFMAFMEINSLAPLVFSLGGDYLINSLG